MVGKTVYDKLTKLNAILIFFFSDQSRRQVNIQPAASKILVSPWIFMAATLAFLCVPPEQWPRDRPTDQGRRKWP